MPDRGRPVCYLVTAAGIPNLGDELIAATWVRYLGEVAPECDLILDCFEPNGVSAALHGLHPRVRYVSTLWQLCFRNWAEGVKAGGIVEAAVRDPSSAGDLAEGLELLLGADVIHLAGGGFVNGLWPAFFGLLPGVAAAAEQTGGVVAMTGQGFNPVIEGAADLLPEVAARFDVIDVRDKPSRRLVGDLGSCSGDDVFLDLDTRRNDPDVDAPSMMVSVQSMVSDFTREQLVAFVADTAAEWNAPEVGLLECSPGEDKEILDLVEQALPATRRYRMTDVLRNGFPASPQQSWLCTRFHPHLLAAAGGASGVAVNVNGDYYGTKHGSLIEQGSRWQLVGDELKVPDKPGSGGFTPADLADRKLEKLRVAQRIYADAIEAGANYRGATT